MQSQRGRQPARRRGVARVTRLMAPSLGTVCIILMGGCSLNEFDRASCATDADCVSAFGAGFTCASDGFCDAASAPLDDCLPGGECALAETCQGEVPVLTTGAEFVSVTTLTLGDDFSDLASCTGSQARGSDGFFAIDMNAGEKWHFHVRGLTTDANPSVYVLSSCDARVCQPGDAIDACGDGADEHISFVAPAAGRYFVGVDSRASGGADYQLLSIRPTCGNGGVLEHSESCDDGNTVSGDGCDSACRAELRDIAPAEVEPNDDTTSANVAMLGADNRLTVTGRLGGRCDTDRFLLEVPADGTVQAIMGTVGGGACNDTAPPIVMQMLASDGVSIVGEGSVSESNDCPSIEGAGFAEALSAGVYYVLVTTGEDEAGFDYSIDLSVQ